MERLTVRSPESDEAYLSCEKCGKKAISECWDEMDCQQTVLERLAAIEDILGEEYDLNRLFELVEADRDGRCVVLPCKIGTIVYSVRHQKVPDDEYRMSFHEELSVVSQVFGLHHADCIGKTVFLTREAAGSALKGE